MSDSSEENESGTGTEEDDGSDEKSGSGSGSDDEGSGSGGDESGDGSDSDDGSGSGSGSGSGEGSDEDGSSGSGSESDEPTPKSKKKKNKKEEEKEEQKFEYVPTKFQSLMSALKNINNELDGTAKTVEALDSKVTRNRGSAGGRLDAKALLSEIDRELGKDKGSPKKSGADEEEDQDAKKPRNFHPPESPVRRVYEDGFEMNSNNPQGNTGKFVGMPGYTQTLYPQVQYGQGGFEKWQSAPNMAQSAYAGSAFGQQQPGPQTYMSRFANTRGSPYGPRPGQLAPRTYTDFYRAQTYLQTQNAQQMQGPIPPGMGGAYTMPQAVPYPRQGGFPGGPYYPQQAHPAMNATAPAGFMQQPAQKQYAAGGGTIRTGRGGTPSRAGLTTAINTLLK